MASNQLRMIFSFLQTLFFQKRTINHMRFRSIRVRSLLCLWTFAITALACNFLLSAQHNFAPTRIKTLQTPEFGHVRTIPRIIHQSYKDAFIPKQYWDSVRSWREKHPDYMYMFWTDEDIRHFIEKEYPDFVPLFGSYTHKLQRIDAVRYFILYHYGGVYADMDVDALKPMDALLSRYSCVLSRERFEQTMYLWHRSEAIMNCVMAAAQRHPFMKFVMFKLQDFVPPYILSAFYNMVHSTQFILKSTGPLALSDIFYLYKPCNRHTRPCDVYLAQPQELLPKVSASVLASMRSFCGSWSRAVLRLLSPWRERACKEMERVNYQNALHNASWTDHHFSNLGYKSVAETRREAIHIKELVGKYARYGDPQ